MEMPKQMGAGNGEVPRQRQQGDADETKARRDAKVESAQRDDGQPKTTQFSDWASI